MKICFVTIGNIELIATMKRALGMAGPLHKLGWQVSIIAMQCKENRERIALECGPQIEIHYYNAGKMMDEVRQKTNIANHIKPDYIYFCSFSIRNRILKSKLNFSHKIIIEHSELQSAIRGIGMIKKTLAYLMEYGSVRYADILVCASQYLMKVYAKNASAALKPAMPVFYSPYAFNKDVLDVAGQDLKNLKEKYPGKVILLYMGTLTRNYGLFTMIEAVEQISDRLPNVKLLLMGNGRHKEEARNYVREHNLENSIDFTGYVPETALVSYFQLADAFISPLNNTMQDWARCPSKIYMYLPFKKPVLTCAIGEPLEMFGENGNYFDNDSPATLANLIEDLVNNVLVRPVVEVDKYSWDFRCMQFNDFINTLTTKD